jgi:hypothetical protein
MIRDELRDQASGRVPAGTYGADQTAPLVSQHNEASARTTEVDPTIRCQHAAIRQIDRGENHEPGAREGIDQST